jgi:hypothetical protein
MSERLFTEGDKHLKELCDAPVPTNSVQNILHGINEKFMQYLI